MDSILTNIYEPAGCMGIKKKSFRPYTVIAHEYIYIIWKSWKEKLHVLWNSMQFSIIILF